MQNVCDRLPRHPEIKGRIRFAQDWSYSFAAGAGQSEQRFYKDVTNGPKIGLGVLQKSMTKLWKQPFFELCCAPHKLLLCCLSTEHSWETRQLSTLPYKTLTGVCVCVFGSSTCARKCVCVFACGYSWALMTTLGNSSWHQLHSIALLHQIASASMTKRSPLQIFQNHVVLTVPFISRGTSLELHLASQDGFRGVA